MKYLLIVALVLPLNHSFAKESKEDIRIKSLTILTLFCPLCLVPAIMNEGTQIKENSDKKDLKPKEPIQRNLASESKKK